MDAAARAAAVIERVTARLGGPGGAAGGGNSGGPASGGNGGRGAGISNGLHIVAQGTRALHGNICCIGANVGLTICF